MRIMFLLLMVGSVAAYSEEKLHAIFDNLVLKEGLVLGETYETRLDIFIVNCLSMNKTSSDGRKPTLNDMYTEDEKRARGGAVLDHTLKEESEKSRNRVLQKREESTTLLLSKRAPRFYSSVRFCNEPVNQGVCGNCYLHTFIGALEIAYTKFTGKKIKFSEQELTDCYYRGCHGGDPRSVARTMAVSDHLSRREQYGDYLSFDIKDNFVCRAATTPDALQDIKVVGYVDVTVDNVEAAISSYGSVMTCLDWYNKCKGIDEYARGVYNGPTVSGGCDHAVLIVGYTPYWYIVRNSHGKTWGEKGYFRIARNKNTCGIEDDMAALVVERRVGGKGTAANGCPAKTPKLCDSTHTCAGTGDICLPADKSIEKREAPEFDKRENVEIKKRCSDIASTCARQAMLCTKSPTMRKVCSATCNTCSEAIEPVLTKEPSETKGKCYRPVIANGIVEGERFMNSGSVVVLKCNTGYELEGDSVKCLIQGVYYSEKTKDGRLLPECFKVNLRGVLAGNGADYVGTASKSLTGKTCQSWNAEILRGVLPLKEPQARKFLQGNNNLCRNPGGSQPVPFCIVGHKGEQEYCFKYPGCEICEGAVDEDEDCAEYRKKCDFKTIKTKNVPMDNWKYCKKTCCKAAGCF